MEITENADKPFGIKEILAFGEAELDSSTEIMEFYIQLQRNSLWTEVEKKEKNIG